MTAHESLRRIAEAARRIVGTWEADEELPSVLWPKNTPKKGKRKVTVSTQEMSPEDQESIQGFVAAFSPAECLRLLDEIRSLRAACSGAIPWLRKLSSESAHGAAYACEKALSEPSPRPPEER